MPAAIVLHAKILNVFVVAREARRTRLQHREAEALLADLHSFFLSLIAIFRPHAGSRTTEHLHKLLIRNGCKPLVYVAHDFIPTRGEDVRRQPIATRSQHAVAGLQVDVVAAAQRLLALRTDIAAEMSLVGRFVGREAGIAVEAIHAVLHLYVGDLVVELSQAIDGLLDSVVETLAASIVFCLVLQIPSPVVVGSDAAKKVQDSCCFHNDCFFS